jgi:ketosteroid isomerase-like protein
MKRTVRAVTCVLLAVSGLLERDGVGAAAGSVAAEIDQLEREWNQARMAGDVARLESLLSDDWILVHGDGRLDSKQGYVASFKSGDRRIGNMETSELQVRAYGDTAVAVLRSKAAVWRGGRGPLPTDQRYTHVWVRQGGRWTMVSAQGTSIEAR